MSSSFQNTYDNFQILLNRIDQLDKSLEKSRHRSLLQTQEIDIPKLNKNYSFSQENSINKYEGNGTLSKSQIYLQNPINDQYNIKREFRSHTDIIGQKIKQFNDKKKESFYNYLSPQVYELQQKFLEIYGRKLEVSQSIQQNIFVKNLENISVYMENKNVLNNNNIKNQQNNSMYQQNADVHKQDTPKFSGRMEINHSTAQQSNISSLLNSDMKDQQRDDPLIKKICNDIDQEYQGDQNQNDAQIYSILSFNDKEQRFSVPKMIISNDDNDISQLITDQNSDVFDMSSNRTYLSKQQKRQKQFVEKLQSLSNSRESSQQQSTKKAYKDYGDEIDELNKQEDHNNQNFRFLSTERVQNQKQKYFQRNSPVISDFSQENINILKDNCMKNNNNQDLLRYSTDNKNDNMFTNSVQYTQNISLQSPIEIKYSDKKPQKNIYQTTQYFGNNIKISQNSQTFNEPIRQRILSVQQQYQSKPKSTNYHKSNIYENLQGLAKGKVQTYQQAYQQVLIQQKKNPIQQKISQISLQKTTENSKINQKRSARCITTDKSKKPNIENRKATINNRKPTYNQNSVRNHKYIQLDGYNKTQQENGNQQQKTLKKSLYQEVLDTYQRTQKNKNEKQLKQFKF